MIRQTILPFKVEMTRDMITPHTGLALLSEFAVGLRFLQSIDRYLPKSGSRAGYNPSEYIFPLILMFNGGGQSLEDTHQIRADDGLKEILPLKKTPSSDAFGECLRNMGINGGLYGLEKVKRRLLKQGMKPVESLQVERYDGVKCYTLDIDATGIVAEKESVKMTCKAVKGYMPVGHIAENGWAFEDELREDNNAPGARNLEFIKHCERQMPKGKIKALIADSTAYQADIINDCESKDIKVSIGADLDEAVLKTIREIPDNDRSSYKSGYSADTVHSMNKKKGPFVLFISLRLIVIRRPYQRNIFSEQDTSVKHTEPPIE